MQEVVELANVATNDQARVKRGMARMFPGLDAESDERVMLCVVARIVSTDLLDEELNKNDKLHALGVAVLRWARLLNGRDDDDILWPMVVAAEAQLLEMCLEKVKSRSKRARVSAGRDTTRDDGEEKV